MIQLRRLLVLALLLLASGCAETVKPPPRNADFYLQEGDSFFGEERYDDAIASWQKVRDNFFSPESNALAEFKIAEAYFDSERYAEAAVASEG